MNRENILAVADAIEKHSIPDLGFNMGNYVTTAGSSVTDNSGYGCGTVACIAGWCKAVRDGKAPQPVWVDDFNWEKQASWLGLSVGEGERLFIYYPGHGNDIQPSQAVSVLRHLAETGEVDWDRALAEPSK